MPVLLCHLEGAVPPRAGVLQLAGSTLLSLNSRPSSCLPLCNRVTTFLFCCICQHTLNLLAVGTSPVLLLEPVSGLSYFSSIWTRNMPTRISLKFFLNPGLQLKGVCSQSPWVSSSITASYLPPHTCTPLTGQHGGQSPRSSPNLY